MRSPRLRHYFWGFPPLVVVASLLLLFKVGYFNILFFVLGYSWNFALLTPGMGGKVRIRKNRFSVLRMAYRTNQFLYIYTHGKRFSELSRCIPPAIFAGVIFVLTKGLNPLFILLGVILYELILRCSLNCDRSLERKRSVLDSESI